MKNKSGIHNPKVLNPNSLRKKLLTTSSATILPAKKDRGAYEKVVDGNKVNSSVKGSGAKIANMQATGSPHFWAKCVRSVAMLAALNAQMAPLYAGKVSLYHIDTFAGDGYKDQDGNARYTGDGNLATSASLNNPTGVALDSANNLYIADYGNNLIRVVPSSSCTLFGTTCSSAGNIYTIAGNYDSGGSGSQYGAYSGDSGSATLAGLATPFGITLDSGGNLYIADTNNNVVRFVAATSGTYFGQSCSAGNFYTIAGHSGDGSLGDSGSATSAHLNQPNSVSLDTSGNLYIADTGNYVIRFVAKGSGSASFGSYMAGNIYTIAGDSVNHGPGNEDYSGDGGPASSAALNIPLSVTVDGTGNLYIAEADNHVIRFVAAASGTYFGQSCTSGDIYTIAGRGGDSAGDGVPATSVDFGRPGGVSLDTSGNLFITDQGSKLIRFMPKASFGSASAGYIYSIAGNGTATNDSSTNLGDSGTATSATLQGPTNAIVDPFGNVYIADRDNQRIRKLTVNYIASGSSDTALTNTDYGLFETINLAGGTLVAGASGAGAGLTISTILRESRSLAAVMDSTKKTSSGRSEGKNSVKLGSLLPR